MISFRVSNLVLFSFHVICALANQTDYILIENMLVRSRELKLSAYHKLISTFTRCHKPCRTDYSDLHGDSQSLFPSFQYYPFKYHRSYVPNNFQPSHFDHQPDNRAQGLFRRPLFKGARQSFNYNEPTMKPRLLDRSDEIGSSDRTSDTFNSPNFSIMRGGTFLEDDRSGEDLNVGQLKHHFNGYKPSPFSEEAESSSYREPVYQQFDGFRDFADLSLPTSSKLVYQYTSLPDQRYASVINDGCEPEKKLSKSRFKQKLESENRKLLTKSNVKMKIIHSKMLFNNNARSQSQ